VREERPANQGGKLDGVCGLANIAN
jgi:hypothetical protein